MRSIIATVINSRVQMNISFYFFVMSETFSVFFFIAKNTTVTAYLPHSSLARFKKCCLLFYSYGVFARIHHCHLDIYVFLNIDLLFSGKSEGMKL